LTRSNHVQRLRDLAGRMIWLEVRCGRCPRHGRLRLARLLAERGPDTTLPDALRPLIANCPMRDTFKPNEQCGLFVADLASGDGLSNPSR
jgi:hypothetical protein